MKKANIFYWVFTGLFSAMMLGSAIPDIINSPIAVQGMHNELGYPLYFIPFIGAAKVLGVLAVLLPISPRVKEWAYAGLVFDLIGATFSIIAIGSYVFYHKKRTLQKNTRSILRAKVIAA